MTVPSDLVIGGTGMLSSLCERIAREGVVTVVARNRARLDRLATASPNIHPVAVDYKDGTALAAALDGRYRGCVCWVHEEVAPAAPLIVSDIVDGSFWHVMGSASADPSRPEILEQWRTRFRARHPDLDYRQIVLGFENDGGASRWLTDSEISDGVWHAMQDGVPVSVVGTVSPWSRRP